MAILIGIDTGTSATKALAIDETGAIVARCTIEYPLHHPKPGWAEQDPADWRAAAFECLRAIAQSVDPADVKAIGLTGQMHGSVFLDENNDVLRPALLWCDQRTTAQCDAINNIVGEDRLLEMVLNPALTGFTAPKILWLRDNEPEVYSRVRKVLLPKDYIRFALTGVYATDVADASGTLLFDIRNRCWHDELLGLLDIPREWMPDAFEGPEVTGTFTADAARQTGLPAGIPVIAGGGDQAAGAVGCGIVKPGFVSASLGTSGVVFAHSERISPDPEGRVHTFCHSVPGAWHVMGVMLSAGGALQWYRNTLCDAERHVATQTGQDAYDLITAEAATVPPGAEGLLFLPYLSGERTPHKDPYARGAFIGLSPRHTKAHMARAVLEGVSFGMRDSVEILRELDVPVWEVRISGGGGKSPFWRQLMADVCNAPMVVTNVDEGPAFGAAILAAVGAGCYASVEEACDATLRVVDATQPDGALLRKYEEWAYFYKKAYADLAEYFTLTGKLLESAPQ